MPQQRRPGARAMVSVVTVAAWAGALVLAAGYLGALHPIGDSFAVFREEVAVATVLLAMLSGPWRPARWAPAAIGALVLAHLALPHLEEAAPGPISVYQKNMLFVNADWEALAEDIRAAEPDVALIQEMTGPNYRVVERVSDILPNEIACRARDGRVGGTIIVTRYEVVPGSERCERGVVSGRLETPEGPVTFAVVHLRWPWPYGQTEHVERILPGLADLERPVVLTGDLNSAPWSHAAARLAAAVGAQPLRPAVESYPLLPLVTLPIDHVFAASGTLERRPLAGSDHYGVLARVSPRPLP